MIVRRSAGREEPAAGNFSNFALDAMMQPVKKLQILGHLGLAAVIELPDWVRPRGTGRLPSTALRSASALSLPGR